MISDELVTIFFETIATIDLNMFATNYLKWMISGFITTFFIVLVWYGRSVIMNRIIHIKLKELRNQGKDEEVPDDLFTQNKLCLIGLVSTKDHVAFVSYPEQRREYKLFDINETRKRKKRSGFSLVEKNLSVEQVLEARKHQLKVRKGQLG